MEPKFLVDPTMTDLVDGTFRVFGKAIRVVLDQNDKISLLRKSTIGEFKEIGDALKPMKDAILEYGFNGSINSKLLDRRYRSF